MTNKILTDISYLNILKISSPTILSALSAGIMSMLDVLILAKYSTIAMTAVASAATWCNVFQVSTISLIMITGTLVGQYNGSGKYKLAGIPVWQMIWFSLSLFIISIPLSYIIAPYCIPERLQSYGTQYLKIVLGCSPLFCIKVALSYFLVSIGKGFIVSASSFIAIIVNTILDIFLIFYCNYGTTGAAIGTVMACFSEVIFLSYFFFRKDIRLKYGTLKCKLRIKRLLSYLKLGILASIANIIESSIFSSIYYILAKTNQDKALTQTIASEVWSVLVCLGAGFEKGVLAITANLLGASLKSKITILLKKSINIHLIFILMLFTFILLLPDLIINNFVNVSEISSDLHKDILDILKLVAICFTFDGIVWIEVGILAAGGDMNYTMPTICACLFIFLAIPIYFIINTENLSVSTMWLLYTIADIACSLVLFKRYKSNKWVKIEV